MSKLTMLERIQLEVELEEIKKEKFTMVSEKKYDEAANLRDREKELEGKLGIIQITDNEDSNTIYNKKNVMIDKQINAFDDEGEPIEDYKPFGELTILEARRLDAEKEEKRKLDEQTGLGQTWDYKGHKTRENYCQKDWNQTLMTRINNISSIIHENTLRGGGNLIEINPRLKSLFSALAYCHTNEDTGEMTLCGRYKIEFDNSIVGCKIIVKHIPKPIGKDGNNDFVFIPVGIKKEGSGMGTMSEVSFQLKSRKDDKEEVEAFEAKCRGIITIQNYSDDDVKIEDEQVQVRLDEEKSEKSYHKDTPKELIETLDYHKGLDKDLMNRNYQNEEVTEIQSKGEELSNEEVLKNYQANCDMPSGIMFYLSLIHI